MQAEVLAACAFVDSRRLCTGADDHAYLCTCVLYHSDLGLE